MVKVLQYGSNMDSSRFIGRSTSKNPSRKIKGRNLGLVKFRGKVNFDLWSDKQGPVGDMNPHATDESEGVLYEIDDQSLEILRKIEGKKYRQVPVKVILPDGSTEEAITFIGTEEAREDFRRNHINERPRREYLQHYITGLKVNGGSSSYIGRFKELLPKPRISVPQVYDNPNEAKTDQACLSEEMRENIGVDVGDLVEVEFEGRKEILRVRRAPEGYVEDDSVHLSRKTRERLGINEIGKRSDRDKYTKKYSGVTIRKYEEQTRSNSDLSSRVSSFFVIAGVLGGLFFLSPNLTGNAIAEISKTSTNWIGISFLFIGLISAGFYFTRARRYSPNIESEAMYEGKPETEGAKPRSHRSVLVTALRDLNRAKVLYERGHYDEVQDISEGVVRNLRRVGEYDKANAVHTHLDNPEKAIKVVKKEKKR